MDKLLDETRATADPDKRHALYEDANRLIAAAQPAIWTFTDAQFVAAHTVFNSVMATLP